MRSLLDVNVLIALFDPDHVFHERVHQWWSSNHRHGWASCPLTENAVVRIMAGPAYRKERQIAPRDLIQRLQLFSSQTDHQFWPDDLSLRDGDVFATDHIHSSRQITDLYLLALAAKHKARLVTFDEGIAASAVPAAQARNLCVL